MRSILVFCLLIAVSTTSAAVSVVHNAKIHTLDTSIPSAEALAWSDEGVLLAVGSNDVVLAAYPDAARFDLGGLTVLPGLVDAHAHLMGLGFSLLRVDLMGTTSKAEVIQRLKAFSEDLPASAWLQGRGWDQNDWPEKSYPTRADLDAHFPDRPVWLKRIDGHAAWGNSAALAAADRRLDGDWQPEGGRIFRDEEGQATGVFVDRAMDLIEAAVPKPGPEDSDEALRRALAKVASLGLTGVHEAGTSLSDFERYQRFIKDGNMTVRVYAMADGNGDLLEHLCRTGPVQSPDGLLSARSVKFYADGALGSRGAALLAPYSDDPEHSGLLLQPPEELTALAVRAAGCGLQVNVHAIGDRGNRVVLDALEAAQAAHPQNPARHRVEHAQVIAMEDLSRFKQLGLIASMQPTHATSDMYWAEDRVGPDRIRGAYAWRKLKDLDVPLAFGSDFPVEKVDPLLGFHAAVTRQDDREWPAGGWYPEERMTRQEALHGFTLGAAYAAFQENELGSLSVGKMADLIVLADDPMAVSESSLLKLQVLATVVGGRVVYQAEERPLSRAGVDR